MAKDNDTGCLTFSQFTKKMVPVLFLRWETSHQMYLKTTGVISKTPFLTGFEEVEGKRQEQSQILLHVFYSVET